MAVSKKFLEAVSKDAALKAELDKAALETLGEVLKEHGLEDEAVKAVEAATAKIAEAHGFKAEAMEEISEDELAAVAGGGRCACCFYGGGGGDGLVCVCTTGGEGIDGSNLIKDFKCGCVVVGAGDN